MIIYFVESSKEWLKNFFDVNVENFLVSYYYEEKGNLIDHILANNPNANIILDSGAYTAMTQKKEIDLTKYMEYIKNNKNKFKNYFVLDVINNPVKSLENYNIMVENKLNPIPVFHVYEDFKYLEHYVKVADYIAIGGATTLKFKKRELINFIENCISMIPKGKKIHLLGVSSYDILMRFGGQVHSVDSSSMNASMVYHSLIDFSGTTKHIKLTNIGKATSDQINERQKYIAKRYINLEAEINQYWRNKNG